MVVFNHQDMQPNFAPIVAKNNTSNFANLDFDLDTARLVLLNTCWDVTSKIKSATIDSTLRQATSELELFDLNFDNVFEKGIFWLPQDAELLEKNNETRALLKRNLNEKDLEKVNSNCEAAADWVFVECVKMLSENKIVGLVGGDSSLSLSHLRALAGQYQSFGILNLSTKFRLQPLANKNKSGKKFVETTDENSFSRALEACPQITKLVNIGSQDFDQVEILIAQSNEKRIVNFLEQDISEALFEGNTWQETSEKILEVLPKQIYISFDPNVLESLSLGQLNYLLNQIARSPKSVIGFDLVNVDPSFDQTKMKKVAKLLYKLCCLGLK
jgi:agmatinase